MPALRERIGADERSSGRRTDKTWPFLLLAEGGGEGLGFGVGSIRGFERVDRSAGVERSSSFSSSPDVLGENWRLSHVYIWSVRFLRRDKEIGHVQGLAMRVKELDEKIALE